ncbi:MAG TPA: phosphodiesterase [Allosphingosinicella sp.]|nr:phosphodiesterase [Allosphingosinicella sp.]
MLVAQITDIHLGFEPGNPDELNRQRLDTTLRVLTRMDPRPDILLATGDIADNGDDAISYRRWKEAILELPFPVYPAMGNHDSRGPFLAAFPEQPVVEGFLQYAIEGFPVRILVLDTLEVGRHGGGFCEIRAAWLRARLAEQPQRPTMLVLHHPPIETGLSWMTENPDAAWVKRLEAIIAGQDNIVAMVTGHLHRPLVTGWAGTVLAVCPSTAPLVALDLEPMQADAPDDRAMIVADRPYFALHYWNGRQLISHFDTAETHDVLARFSEYRTPMIRKLKDERAKA